MSRSYLSEAMAGLHMMDAEQRWILGNNWQVAVWARYAMERVWDDAWGGGVSMSILSTAGGQAHQRGVAGGKLAQLGTTTSPGQADY